MLKKNFLAKIIGAVLIIFVIWGLLVTWQQWTPAALAAGGISVYGVNDDVTAGQNAGGTPDLYLNDTAVKKAFLIIEAFEETAGGVLNSVSVCLDEKDGFNPSIDLSEVELWRDNGGDISDGIFTASGENADTRLGSVTSLSTVSDSFAMGGTCQQVIFPSLNLPIPTTWGTKLKLFVVTRPKANLNASPLHAFNPLVRVGGIDVTVNNGSTISDWPSGNASMFPQVFLGTEGQGMMGAPLVISEIQTAGTDADDEFIELYNRNDSAIDFNGSNFILAYAASSTADDVDLAVMANWTATTSISTGTVPAFGFYLLGGATGSGYDAATAADGTFSDDFVLPENGGIIGLFSPQGFLLDKVAYGNVTAAQAEGGQPAPAPEADGSLERKAFPDSTASKLFLVGVHVGKGNGEDSNNNLYDFVTQTTSVPQNTESAVENFSGGFDVGATPVLINEVLYNTAATNGWLELYNRSNEAADIAGWKIISNGDTYTVPADTTIGAKAYLVVYWNKSGTDSATVAYTANSNGTTVDVDLATFGNEIILKNGADALKDYVEYGGGGFANEMDAALAGQWMLGDAVPNCLYNQSIGRRSMSGEDYNGSGDWQCYNATSPGFANMGGDSTAPTTVASVILSDPDNTANSGLNGSDIRIVWTPSTAPDPSFDYYAIYLLSATTTFNDATQMPIDRMHGGQYQYSGSTRLADYTYNGGNFITKDSVGAILSSRSYKAYVVAVDFAGNRSGAAESAAVTPVAETYSADNDTQQPFIMHMPVWQAKADADLVLMVRADDDRALADSNPVQIVWEAGTNASPPDLSSGATTTNCAAVEGGFYSCTISWDEGWDSDTVIGYYMKVTDAATTPNVRYMSGTWDDNMNAAGAQSNAIMINILAADDDALGDYTDAGSDADLSGFVLKSDGSAFAADLLPHVFVEGTAGGYVTAASSTGAFSFADDTLTPGSHGVVAFKANYMDMFVQAFKNDNLTLRLNQGGMNFVAGGNNDKPVVTWTAPGDNMIGAPINIFCTGTCATVGAGEMPVVIAFDRAMNESTINDQDAANANSNIYLTSNGQDRISGKVYYDSANNQARFYATAADSLTPGTFYSIVVTQGVTDTNGTPILGGGLADGSFVSGFTTMMDNSNLWGNGWQEGGTVNVTNYGSGGMMMPPFVKNTTPSPGSFGFKVSRSLLVEFSDPMNSSSITNTSIRLYPVANEANWTLGSAVAATVTLDQATQKIATIDPTSALSTNTANHGWYVLKVMGNVKSSTGVWLGDPSACNGVNPDVCLADSQGYQMSFQVDTNADTATDTTKPTVVAVYPANDATGISVGLPFIDIGFSESMDLSTITTQNISLKAGSTAVAGKVFYDPGGNMAKFIPNAALSSNTQYTLTVGIGVTDASGNAINAAYTSDFKTGASDTAAPTVMYANGDDYRLAVTYSESMNAAKQSDTAKWSTSVLNPANYFVKTLNNGSVVAPYSSATTLSGLNGLSLAYDEPNNTVTIEGFTLFSSSPHPTDLQVFVDNAIDRSNNQIASSTGRLLSGQNAAQTPIQNSANTSGQLGPGGPGGEQRMNMGDMGMMKAGAMPMNGMAGQNSMYFVQVPTTKSIPAGGSIKLSFPSGFDVTSATKDLYSPKNSDINEWNAGAITISVAANQATRTITVTTAGAATQTNDFLKFDLKGIVNSVIPKDFGTDGYTVDIKTFSNTGALLENITSMPFFITQGGAYTLSGTITMRNGNNTANVNVASGQTMRVFLGSPMTGPMEATVTFDGDHNATYSFAGLREGEYHLFTEPTITVNATTTATDFSGFMTPEPLFINETTDAASDSADNNIIDKNLTLTKVDATAGTAVVINLLGDFSTDDVADSVDIFANSYNNFKVKTVTAAGSQDGNTDYTLYLPDGDWMIGVGPAMPKGPMSGPPLMPDWMSPMPINVKVAAAGSPAVREASDTANDGTLVFDVSSQSVYTVSGTVTDGSNGIADAEVYAYQAQGGYAGANTKTKTDGSFTLKIPIAGIYKIGAHKPGLPEGKEITQDVQGNVSDLFIKMKKPAYTISGKVLNTSSQSVAYAPVWAKQTNGPGHANTMSDASGNYILYVDNGTWQVEGDIPGYGWTQYDRVITINNVSQSSINLKPDTATTWVTISGTITIGGSTQNYMPIRAVAYDANGNHLGREYGGSTNGSGQYSISVPAGTSGSDWKYYRVDIWTPDYGEVGLSTDGVANSPANLKLTTSNATDADITIASDNLKTVTIQFDNKADYGTKEAFINIDGVSFSGDLPQPNGFHKSIRVTDLAGDDPTISLTAGDYFWFVDVPGYGQYMPKNDSPAFDNDKFCVTVDGTDDTVQFALPDLNDTDTMITISGTISGPSAGQKDAWVWVGNPQTGFHAGQQANVTTGAYSLIVPKLSSGNYFVGSDKPGYISGTPVNNDGTADADIDFTLTAQNATISGVIFTDADADNAYDNGEQVANGWVRAENISTGATAHGPVDGTGAYVIGVTDGIWKIFGMANGYSESQYSVNGLPTLITVSGSNVPSKNIKLTTNANWNNKTKSSTLTPSAGGTIDDTSQNTVTGQATGTGVKITAPPNALGSSSSSGTVSAATTAAVAGTNSTKPFDSKGQSITATDNSGQPITTLDNYIDLEMVLYMADINAADNVVDKSKLKTMQVKYWDDTMNDWVGLPTTRNAYYKAPEATDWTLYNGNATTTGYQKFIDDALGAAPTFILDVNYTDYKLVLTASTNHLTVFAPGISPDGLAPAAPANVVQSTGAGTAVGLTWGAVSTNADASTVTDLYGYSVYRSTNGTDYAQINTSAVLAGTQSFTDTSTAAWTSYYYKITAGDDDDLESAYSTALLVCSTNTVTNGTVGADCTITCNTGYSLSGQSCNASGGSMVGGGGPFSTATPTYQSYNPETGELLTGDQVAQTDQAIIEEAAVNQSAATISVADGEPAIDAKGKVTIAQILSDAAIVAKGVLSDILTVGAQTRDLASEAKFKTITDKIVAKTNISVATKELINNFITYGTPATKALGVGERGGVVNSFQAAFGKLPSTETDWSDVIKIANGRWPTQTNSQAESKAVQAFKKIYLRAPDRANAKDDAAVTVMAYGLRPADRNMASEAAAIKSFKAVYKYNPSSATDWDVVRAIAYSGASRQTSAVKGVKDIQGAIACQPDIVFSGFLIKDQASAEIRSLQNFLQCLGYFPADQAATGRFGEVTETAVKAFQSANDIEATGYVGPATRQALNAHR